MKRNSLIYFLLPAILFIPQVLMSFHFPLQLRFEELIESVQSVYWFDQRQLISGLHVNVGWYALLDIIYNIFGFYLYTGKVVNLVFAFLSSYVLAYLLKRFFELKIASLILITILLSPSLLFINSESLHWALTFHLMILIVFLFVTFDSSYKKLGLFSSAILWLTIMICWLFYQAVIFYLPSLAIFYLIKLNKLKVSLWPNILAAGTAFLMPILALFSWIQNRSILIKDDSVGGGLFRGGGAFVFSPDVFSQAWADFISDFFIKGISHHFEVYLAEFSLIFPIITLIFVFYCIYVALHQHPKSKLLIWLSFLVMAIDLFVFSTTSDLGLPGMKRVTPLLATFYFLWVLSFYYLPKLKLFVPKKVAILLLSLLTLHHLIVLPLNLMHVSDPSPFQVTDWFDSQDPQKYVEGYISVIEKQDLELDCREQLRQYGQCFYDFIYPTIAGSCQWNNLDCHKIKAYDPNTRQFKELGIEYFKSDL